LCSIFQASVLFLFLDNSYAVPAVSSSTEARNIFYEQELAKKDKLIVELRFVFCLFWVLENVDANMEYLRNVFIQFLHCESSSGRKPILKAIATVLKLSQAEMKYIDKR
uniref:GRIP domain-containing protein n=1 Tax=Syphacia muris TaxID=451379 RepID=A0A158R4K1_9BILA